MRLNVDIAFHKAVDPDPYDCLGLTLQPLTIGHWFLLQKFCPAAVDEFSTEGSLGLAVIICCKPYAKSVKNLNRKASLILFALVLGWVNRKKDMEVERKKFSDYIAASFQFPMMESRGDSSPPPNAPLVWKLYCILMGQLNHSKSEALNTTINEAACLAQVHAENSGLARLKSSKAVWLWENRKSILAALNN